MTTNFLIRFPHAHGYPKHVHVASGVRHRQQAFKDDKRGKQVTMRMDRDTFDSVSTNKGSLALGAYNGREAVADIDFSAHDGTLHKTAEECLAYELQERFGVNSLDELESLVLRGNVSTNKHSFESSPAFVEALSDSQREHAINKACERLGFVHAVNTDDASQEPEAVTASEAIRLVAASMATKSRSPKDIEKDTGLSEQVIYNTLSQNPHLFKVGPGGRYSRIQPAA